MLSKGNCKTKSYIQINIVIQLEEKQWSRSMIHMWRSICSRTRIYDPYVKIGSGEE